MGKDKDLHQIDLITGKTFLDSWKEISNYLERSEKTCRKWEKELGLPIHRLEDSPKARVFAYREELDTWMKEKLSVIEEENSEKKSISKSEIFLAKKWTMFSLIILSLFIVAIFNYNVFFKNRNKQNIIQNSFHTLAVLPLENINGKEKVNYFTDGLTDSVLTELARIRGLKVISRTSIMNYKNVRKPLSVMAEELNADFIVQGTVSQSEEIVRISIHLISIKSKHHIWSGNYERKYENILSLQKEIVLDIIEHISIILSPEYIGTISSPGLINLSAYEYFIRGCIEFDKTTLESLYSAIDLFESSFEENPGFARAYAWIGISYSILAKINSEDPRSMFKKAKIYADKALALDNMVPEAHAVMGFYKWGYEWDFAGAEKEFKLAISLSPSSAIVRNFYWIFLYSIGKKSESLNEINIACELDPHSLFNLIMKKFLSKENIENKIRNLEKLKIVNPLDFRIKKALALLYLRKGEIIKSKELLINVNEIRKNHYQSYSAVAKFYADQGMRKKAEEILNDLLDRDKKEYISPTCIAIVYIALGDYENAFRFIERAYKEKDWLLLRQISVWEGIDLIRSDQRFKDLKNKIGINTF